VAGKVIIGAGARGGGTMMIMSAGPVLAFDAATGRKVWAGGSGPQGYAAIATDGKRLYAGTGGSSYSAFSLADGRALWRHSSGHQRRQFMSMTVVGDSVYVPVTIGGIVAKLSADRARTAWVNAAVEINLEHQMNHGGEFGHECFTDLAVSNGRVYAGFNDGQFIAFDAETGEKEWTHRTEQSIQSSPSVAGGRVYFGAWDGWLRALDAKTGELRWKRQLGDKINSSPWPGDGVIYVGCDDGRVYALE